MLPSRASIHVSLFDGPIFIRIKMNIPASSGSREKCMGQNRAGTVERVAVTVKSTVEKYCQNEITIFIVYGMQYMKWPFGHPLTHPPMLYFVLG